jgi:hypothetical protein
MLAYADVCWRMLTYAELSRLDEVVLERDELKAAAEIMQHRCKALQERC